MQGSTPPFFSQDLGFHGVAMKRAQEREDVCILLFQRNCFAFHLELKGCGGTWRQAQEQQLSLYIC